MLISLKILVPEIGLEPIRFVQPRDFKSLASAYSAIRAYLFIFCIKFHMQGILSLLRLPISPYSHIYTQIFSCYAMQRLRLFVCRFRHTGAFLWDFCLAACGGLHGALPRRRRFFCAPLPIFFPCGGFLRKIAPRLAVRSLRSAVAAPFSGRQGKKAASASREAEADLLEAPPGFEPGSQGFAGPCLTTWL